MNEIEVSAQNSFCKAVIFDMDGTLIESTNADFLAWQKVFADYDKVLTFQDYTPMLGKRSFAVVKELLHIKDEKEQAVALSNKSLYFRKVIDEQGLETVPYAVDFLKQIKKMGIPMALATSSRREKTKMGPNGISGSSDITKFFPCIDLARRGARRRGWNSSRKDGRIRSELASRKGRKISIRNDRA